MTNQAVLNSINQSHSVVLKLLATPASGDLPSAGGASCPGPDNPGTGMTALGGITGLANGLMAWGTHAFPSNTTTAAITETAFLPATLSGGELGKLTGDCRALLTQGGSRTCPVCRTGGLAAPNVLQPQLP